MTVPGLRPEPSVYIVMVGTVLEMWWDGLYIAAALLVFGLSVSIGLFLLYLIVRALINRWIRHKENQTWR